MPKQIIIYSICLQCVFLAFASFCQEPPIKKTNNEEVNAIVQDNELSQALEAMSSLNESPKELEASIAEHQETVAPIESEKLQKEIEKVENMQVESSQPQEQPVSEQQIASPITQEPEPEVAPQDKNVIENEQKEEVVPQKQEEPAAPVVDDEEFEKLAKVLAETPLLESEQTIKTQEQSVPETVVKKAPVIMQEEEKEIEPEEEVDQEVEQPVIEKVSEDTSALQQPDTEVSLDEYAHEVPTVMAGEFRCEDSQLLYKDDTEYSCPNWQFVFKQGYFLPNDKCLRIMLGNGHERSGGYYFEGAARYCLYKSLFLELNGSWFRQQGYSIVQAVTVTTNVVTKNQTTSNSCCYGEKMCFKLPTFGLGLKYFANFCDDWFNVFAGAGLKVFFLRSINDYQGCCSCEIRDGVGGVVGIGTQFKPWCGLIIEGFIDYFIKSFCPSKYNQSCSCSCKVDVGGLAVGLGLGYQF